MPKERRPCRVVVGIVFGVAMQVLDLLVPCPSPMDAILIITNATRNK